MLSGDSLSSRSVSLHLVLKGSHRGCWRASVSLARVFRRSVVGRRHRLCTLGMILVVGLVSMSLQIYMRRWRRKAGTAPDQILLQRQGVFAQGMVFTLDGLEGLVEGVEFSYLGFQSFDVALLPLAKRSLDSKVLANRPLRFM